MPLVKASVERTFFPWNGPAELFINGSMAGIEAAISDHFIMLFRYMLNQTSDEIHNREGFLHILIIFMPVVMKGDKITVIAVDPGSSNDRAAKITAHIFENGFRVAFIRFGINIKTMLMFTVTAGLDGFEGGSDALFHFIEERGTESIAEEIVVKMFDITPKAVIGVAALGNETVDMRVPFQVAAKSMEDHDEAGSEVQGFILLEEHAGDDAGNGMEETVEQRAVIKKKVPEIFINGKDTVSIRNIKQFKSHRCSAAHGIKITTGRAEAAAAAERNIFNLATARTAVHGAAKRGIPTVDHFINIFNDGIPGMQCINHFFKMVCKNAL